MTSAHAIRTPGSGAFARWRLLLFISVIAGAHSRVIADTRPNFVLVVCDNLGYGDIEPFGSVLHRTPNLNRMAAEGRMLTHFCVTAGVCTPSRASLMTGCYAQRVGMHDNPRDGWVLRPVSQYGLHPDEVTVAEVLQQAGYATGMVGKWHLGDQPPFLPTRQGFDWFFGVPYSDDMTERVWGKDSSKWPPLPLMENETVIEAPCDRNGLTKRYTERAVEWITEHKDEPFFLYFPQAMPGSTRTPFSSPEFRGKSRNGPWGDAVEELDWSMGVLLDHLQSLGIAENTLVIWTSDNGAPINRDLKDLSRGSNRPLHGRGYTTSEGAFRVPTLAWQPGTVPADSECDELATTMDLLPTFANLAGAELPACRLDGHDITPLLRGVRNAKTPYDAFYYYQQDQLQAVRSGPWKLFLPVTEFVRHPRFNSKRQSEPLLFNVVEDVSCEHNIAEKHPDIVTRLTELADVARQDLGDLNRRGNGVRSVGKIAGDAKPQLLTAGKTKKASMTNGRAKLQQKPPDALEVIEATRGGRHWVDAETAAPRTPVESLACLETEPGVNIELVAAEPVVRDPVAIAFDQHGDMFVVEYGDYPLGPADGGHPLSKVVLLKDTDADGVMDERHVFADQLNFAHSLMPYRGGLLVGARTEILFLKDTDGDHVADINQIMFDGFTPAHPQMQIGCPRWGIDNLIYCNYGPGDVGRGGDESGRRRLSRKDFIFDPRTMEFHSDTGMGQFGNTCDRWGNRFYCTNRNPIMTTLLPAGVIRRNPYAVISRGHYDVAPSGGAARVFPLIDMKSNYLSHAGTHTSACGVTAYLGDMFDEDFRSSVFVCEPIGHLVTRSVVTADEVTLKAKRARESADFIASTDPWFRPASLATGPDGALYLADMYRLWVEHPKFLPAEIAAKLDWRAGDDRGRIYRISEHNPRTHAFKSPDTPADMVQLLTSKNGWQQYLGQRLLIERSIDDSSTQSDERILNGLRGLLAHPQPTTRIHALWTLHGLSAIQKRDLLEGFYDEDARVRRHAVRLAESCIDDDEVFPFMELLSDDENPRVRLAVTVALGGSQRREAARLLSQLAVQDGASEWFAGALLTTVAERSGAVLSRLTEDLYFQLEATPASARLVRQLASVTGARGDTAELGVVLHIITAEREPLWWRAAAISGLGEGLRRHRGQLGRISLPGLLKNPPQELADIATDAASLLEFAQRAAVDITRSPTDRAAAAELLAFQPFDEAAAAFQQLLMNDQPHEVQAACVNAITAHNTEAAAGFLLNHWNLAGPEIRTSALRFLLQKTSSAKQTLAAMMAGDLPKSALSIDQRVRLLKHKDAELKQQAIALFGGAISKNRREVVQEYEAALHMPSSAAAGRKLFRKTCSNCHRFNGQGHLVGPDLSDIRNRSDLAILYEVLDPNSKVEPRFTAYTVVTIEGRTLSGLVVSETADTVILRMPEGKEKAIPRTRIEQLHASSKSLMPEGIEKDISLQGMADLLAYLKGSP